MIQIQKGKNLKHATQLSLITTLLLTTPLFADEQLEDITVSSATKSTQNIQDVTSNMDVITAEELEERHYSTVTEALSSLAGINFTATGGMGTVSQLYLRGFDNAKTLVLVDGIRYNDVSNLSGAMLENLMISDIQQIEVIKGPQSGIWGADAAAGVINIITKKTDQGLHFHASEEFGSFDSSKATADIAYKNNLFYLKASHQSLSTEGFTAQAPRDQDIDNLEDDGYKNQTTTLQAGVQISPTNKIDLSHTRIDSDTEFDPYGNPNGIEKSTSKTQLSQINYNHVDSFNEVNMFAKRSNFNREYSYGLYKGEINEYGLNSKIPYQGNHFLLWGAEYKSFDDQGSINEAYNNKAFFLTNNNQFNDQHNGNIILTESLRQDNYSAFDDKLTGKIGVKYISNVLEGFSAGANYGTAYSVPTLYHLYDPFSGNALLNPESISGYDVTLGYQDLKVTYFDNTIDDMISYQSLFDASGNWIGGRYQNISGKSKLKGVEVAYQQSLFDDLILGLNYTKLDAKDRDNKSLARRANQTLNFALDYYGIDNVHLGINGQYIGERFDQADKQGQQTGKYTVTNLTADYTIDKSMSIYGKVENIGDKYYQTVDGYATSPQAVYGGVRFSY